MVDGGEIGNLFLKINIRKIFNHLLDLKLTNMVYCIQGGNNMKNYLTTIELAEYYKVSRQAVDLWRKDDKFPVHKFGPRTFRYDIEEVEQYFKNNPRR